MEILYCSRTFVFVTLWLELRHWELVLEFRHSELELEHGVSEHSLEFQVSELQYEFPVLELQNEFRVSELNPNHNRLTVTVKPTLTLTETRFGVSTLRKCTPDGAICLNSAVIKVPNVGTLVRVGSVGTRTTLFLFFSPQVTTFERMLTRGRSKKSSIVNCRQHRTD